MSTRCRFIGRTFDTSSIVVREVGGSVCGLFRFAFLPSLIIQASIMPGPGLWLLVSSLDTHGQHLFRFVGFRLSISFIEGPSKNNALVVIIDR